MAATMVKEIIKSIKDNPEEWKPVCSPNGNRYNQYDGLIHKTKEIFIYSYGFGKSTTLITLMVNGHNIQDLGFMGQWKLEAAVGKWFKTIKVDYMLK